MSLFLDDLKKVADVAKKKATNKKKTEKKMTKKNKKKTVRFVNLRKLYLKNPHTDN